VIFLQSAVLAGASRKLWLLLQLCWEQCVFGGGGVQVSLVTYVASAENRINLLSPRMHGIMFLQCRGGPLCKFSEYCKFRTDYIRGDVRKH